MSYQSIEDSKFDAAPLELWEFTIGSQIYRYCGTDEDITVDLATYTAVEMGSVNRTESYDLDDSSYELPIALTTPLVKAIRSSTLSVPCTYVAYKKHKSDPEVIASIRGSVTGHVLKRGMAYLKLENLLTSINGIGLKRLYSVGCGHQLYGNYCKLLAVNFTVSGEINSVSSPYVTVNAISLEAAGTYTGGFIQWNNSELGTSERMWIIKHTAGGVLQLGWVPPSLISGVSVDVIEGCARTKAACTAKGNDINYGGFEGMPDKNPFGGTPIF